MGKVKQHSYGGSAAAKSDGVVGHNRGRPCSRKGPSLLALSNPQNQRMQSRMSWHNNSLATTPIVCERFVSIQPLTEVLPTPQLSKGAKGEHAATAVDLLACLGLFGLSPVELHWWCVGRLSLKRFTRCYAAYAGRAARVVLLTRSLDVCGSTALAGSICRSSHRFGMARRSMKHQTSDFDFVAH